MKSVLSVVVALSAGLLSAAPFVTVDSVVQDAATRAVTVTYTLSGGPAIVTLDVTPEGGVAPAAVRSLKGDVNKKVSGDTTHVITWYAAEDWGDAVVDAKLDAKVEVWPLSSPPDYMVVDLTIAGDNIRYYRSPEHFPWDGGVHSFDSKYFRMVFRRIPAAGVIWRMGSPETETDRVAGNSEKPHQVLLTNDYYLAVFPTTQRQYYYVTDGDDPSNFKGGSNPVECIYYFKLRGATPDYDWPNTGLAVDPTSFFGRLRAWTGNAYQFDLPTEAEWEYAARAGTGTRFNNPPSGSSGLSNSEKVAWTSRIAEGRTHEVGLLEPNNFGLYDTLGNVREWCRDWWQNDSFETGSVTTNPAGPSAATEFWTNSAGVTYGKRILRGWAWYWSPAYSRSARRDDRMGDHDTRNSIGFRVWAPITGPEQEATEKTETVNGLGDLAGQQNDYWNTPTRRDAVVGVGDNLTATDCLVGTVSAETQKIALMLRDWSMAWGGLPLLDFSEPSGLMIFVR